jgi:hypothetical protein
MDSQKQPDQGTPEPVVNAAALASSNEPPDPWKAKLRWVWKHFGWPGPVIVVASTIGWSQWDRISRLPPIDSLVARINQKSLPKAEAGRFNIAIAHLAGDDDHSVEQVTRASLQDRFPNAYTVQFDRLISSEEGEQEGHERARALLKASGFLLHIRPAHRNQPLVAAGGVQESTHALLSGRK